MWYYTLNGQQAGPVSQSELADRLSNDLSPNTLVWKEGMADWLPANEVAEFKDFDTPSPSDINIYAAPDTVATMAPQEISTNDLPDSPIPLDVLFCIKQGWKFTCGNFGKIFLFGLVYLVLSLFITTLAFLAIKSELTAILMQILDYILKTFINMGAFAFALALIKGQDTSISQLLGQIIGKLFKVCVASLLYGIMIVLGLICFVIPGIYLAIRFFYYQAAIIDKDLGIIESFSYSSELTRDNKLNVFGLHVLNFLIVLAGFLAFGIGLLWAVPTVWLASVISYCYLHDGERAIIVQN